MKWGNAEVHRNLGLLKMGWLFVAAHTAVGSVESVAQQDPERPALVTLSLSRPSAYRSGNFATSYPADRLSTIISTAGVPTLSQAAEESLVDAYQQQCNKVIKQFLAPSDLTESQIEKLRTAARGDARILLREANRWLDDVNADDPTFAASDELASLRVRLRSGISHKKSLFRKVLDETLSESQRVACEKKFLSRVIQVASQYAKLSIDEQVRTVGIGYPQPGQAEGTVSAFSKAETDELLDAFIRSPASATAMNLLDANYVPTFLKYASATSTISLSKPRQMALQKAQQTLATGLSLVAIDVRAGQRLN